MQAAHYDVCVIGGGPAGFAAAFRATDYGKSVLLIEKDRLGGAGLYDGALASKTLWQMAQDYKRIRMHNRGYRVNDVELDFQEVIRVKEQALAQRNQQLANQVAAYTLRLGDRQFRLVKGFGRLAGPKHVEVLQDDGSAQAFEAETIVLATGSRPRKVPNLPIDEELVITSDSIGKLRHLPESMVIIGAGVIGCEYATIFSLFGRTRVHIIDKAERILPFEDSDVAQLVAANLCRQGVVVHQNSELRRLWVEDGRVKFEICISDSYCETYDVEKALVAIGRVPNIEGLGCETLGLALNNRGHFIVDDSRTNFHNIYAVGDLTADICLVNVGENEGRHVIDKVYGNYSQALSYENISTIMFLDPEVAGVGMNEQQAQQAGIAYRVACLDFKFISRAIAMRCDEGFFKILVTDDDEMRILGMRAIGPEASSAIQAISLLISMGRGIHDIAELVHPHPSITEGVLECARMLLGKSILKPGCFAEGLACGIVRQGVRIAA